MSLSNSELQAVLYSVLSNTLSNIPIYDDVPETANTPYIAIGEDSYSNIGGKQDPIYEVTVSVLVFSSYKGMKEVKDLSSQIVETVSGIDTEYSGGFIRFLRLESVEHNKAGDDMRMAEILAVFTVS